jgi:hypothetical protein
VGGLVGGLLGGLVGGLLGGLMGGLVGGLVLTNRRLRLLACLASQVLRFRVGNRLVKRGLRMDLSRRFDLRMRNRLVKGFWVIQEVVNAVGYKLSFGSKVVLDLFNAPRGLVFFLDDSGKRAGNSNILVLGRICSAGP